MGLKKLIVEEKESELVNKKELKKTHRKLDKESNQLKDLLKRIESLEKIVGV